MKRTLLFALLSLCVLCGAMADLPFRNHRYDAFKVLEVDNQSIVFIGNSITNMHDWTTAFDNPHVLNRGNSGAVSDEAIDNLESILVGRPAKVFVMLGTNDMALMADYNKQPEYLAQRVRHLITRVKRESPATEIYIQSVLPSQNSRSPERIQAANTLLRALCTETGATYVDLHSHLGGIIGNTHSRDGLHLSVTGYKIWCDIIAPHVGSACVYPAGITNKYTSQAAAYDMRISTFAGRLIRSTDVMMIGDEMINGGEWHELLGTPNVRNYGQAWGYAGQNLADMLKQIPLIMQGQGGQDKPAAVMLYAGVQQVVGSGDLEDLAGQYRAVAQKIRELAPEATLFLLSHQPTNNAGTNNNRVKPFNQKIQAIAQEAGIGATYVDLYTDFVQAGEVANTTLFNGNYLWGKGYAAVARKLAPHITGATARTQAQTDALYETIAARTALGKAISQVAFMPVGDEVGQYPAAAFTEVSAAVEEAYTLLAAPATTNEALRAAATALGTKLAAVKAAINKPRASVGEDEHWYQFCSSLRGSRLITSTGAGMGVVGKEQHNFATGMWKLVARADGSFDIINRADNSYLSPSAANNSQVKTSATRPAAGWRLSDAATDGMFIIASGTVQLNQTNAAQEFKIYNWGGGSNTTDTGCQYAIQPAGEPEQPVVVTLPDPLLVLGEHKLTGAAPVRVDDNLAAPVLSATEMTVAIDLTAPTASQEGCIIGSCNTAAASPGAQGAFASVFVNNSQKFGMRYADATYLFTGPDLGTTRTQIVIVMQNGRYVYYKQGNQTNNIAYAGVPSLGTVTNADALFLGGLVRSDNTNKFPFTGTIHSVQIFPGALTPEQVALINYTNPIPTAVSEIRRQPAAGDKEYDLAGRPATRKSGIVVKQGKKFLK